eukprot:scaffold49_cov409-Prasinococcus_capsulatus_cf.AAC.22
MSADADSKQQAAGLLGQGVADGRELFTGDTHAKHYAQFRPTYPPELYECISRFVGDGAARDLAMDVGTGSGQAAREIAKMYKKVLATDVSEAQLDEARAHSVQAVRKCSLLAQITRRCGPGITNIEYQREPAEELNVEHGTVDLIAVAQALHWFEHDKFYRRAYQVLKDGGVLCAWGYERCDMGNEAAQKVFHEIYEDILGKYWSPRRRLVEREYE